MPDQAILFMGVRVKSNDPDPIVTPAPVTWRTPTGAVLTVTPKCSRLEAEGYDEETVFGFELNGRYFSKIIDKVNPADRNEGGDGYLLRLDLDQLVTLRASVREWFPGAEVIVTTVFH
jgi:hypothetical protein